MSRQPVTSDAYERKGKKAMAFRPVSNTVKLSFEGRCDNQDVVNTLHVHKTTGGAPTAQNVIDVTETMATEYRSALVALFGAQYSYTATIGTDLTTADGFQHTSNAGSGLPGGNASGSAIPNNVSLCVSLRTGFSGRSRRGRMYLPALRSINLETTNTITVVHAADVLDAVTLLINRLPITTEGVWRPVIVSYAADGAPRAVPVVTEIANAIIVDRTVDSQRRRLPGRGK